MARERAFQGSGDSDSRFFFHSVRSDENNRVKGERMRVRFWNYVTSLLLRRNIPPTIFCVVEKVNSQVPDSTRPSIAISVCPSLSSLDTRSTRSLFYSMVIF